LSSRDEARTRIFSFPGEKKPAINSAAVLGFFEERAEKAKSLGPTRAVIYQDKSPDLAERRDAEEKTLIYPKIQVSKEDKVLDAGCGTGRWAEIIIPNCAWYQGIDISPGLIQIARERFGSFLNAQFSVCSIESVSLEAIGARGPFSRILSFGVYIYLNDGAVLEALKRIVMVAAQSARIVIREPIALENRLTLRDHYSEDMNQHYSAIYRTEGEMLDMFDAKLGPAGFALIDAGDVYKQAELNNRRETKQRWYLYVR
jgi:SAM-dependent methyltransferase